MMPKNPPSSEYATVDGYVEMYGKAMVASTAQILNNTSKAKKRVADALFIDQTVDMSASVAAAGALRAAGLREEVPSHHALLPLGIRERGVSVE